jgi:hypothetical protein
MGPDRDVSREHFSEGRSNSTSDKCRGARTQSRIYGKTITQVLEELVPRAKKSPYNKWWWTRELIGLRDEFTARRNRVTTLRRSGEDTKRARKLADSARRTFHNVIDRQKQDHWKDFLDKPENVWKAAKYAKRREATNQIPDLVVGQERAGTDPRKAEILMEAFFPVPPEPEGRTHYDRQLGQSLEWPELTMHETEKTIFESSQDKAPGPDEITFRVLDLPYHFYLDKPLDHDASTRAD